MLCLTYFLISADNFECVFDGFNTTDDVIKALESVDEFIDIVSHY